MKIETHEIDPNSRAGASVIIENALKLDQTLSKIVQAELKSGNLIADVSTGWPEEGSVVLAFSQRLSADHVTGESVNYVFVNDIRYWIHEYSTTTKPTHLVIS